MLDHLTGALILQMGIEIKGQEQQILGVQMYVAKEL